MAAIGDAGAATFIVDLDSEATISFRWHTDVMTSEEGLEQRSSAFSAPPRQRYEFSTILSDAQQRKVLSRLATSGPAGSLFYLALMHEALPIVSATSSTIVMHSLSLCDWAKDGQRIAIRGLDGTVIETFVDGAPSGATITTGDDVSAVAVEGALAMPLVGIRLDTSQGLPRYQRNLTRWNLTAFAERFRFGADGVPGTGGTVLTFDSLPVWDRGILVDGQRDETALTGASLLDTGGAVSAMQHSTHIHWTRQLAVRSSKRSEWQWFRKFLDTVCGRRKKFLLRTGRPDLVPVGDASSGTLTIDTSAQSYVDSWYPSLAHRRIAIVLTDKSVNYRNVTSTGGGGATEDLVLSSALSGTIERVELVETVRFDTDEITVKWSDGLQFSASFPSIVVQQ